jgi:hypothetical protein
MAMLWVDSSAPAGPDAAPPLREWLDGDWALLFSHPGDFQDRGTETDRWLAIVRDEFRVNEVRALSLSRCGAVTDTRWVAALFGDRRCVPLEAPPAAGGPVDLPSRALRADVLALAPRFVMIIDDTLRRCGVFRYEAYRLQRVCALDLLATIGILRRVRT